MEAYVTAVKKVIEIYVKKIEALPTKKEKVYVMTGLFTYLSTAEVKWLLNRPAFAKYRPVLLRKSREFAKDGDVRAKVNHRTQAVLREVYSYLAEDVSIVRRQSERQKERTVRRLNSCFDHCSSPDCMNIAAELKKWSAVKPVQVVEPVQAVKPVSITVKVLPRRSARLLAQRE
jgi:hypothetical protein